MKLLELRPAGLAAHVAGDPSQNIGVHVSRLSHRGPTAERRCGRSAARPSDDGRRFDRHKQRFQIGDRPLGRRGHDALLSLDRDFFGDYSAAVNPAVTAICSDPKRNVAFYTHNLGLRLVKKTVNFDDPSTWHLYYGDETGQPGTALTFFAWGKVPAGRNGNGMAVETAFIIPERSLGYWTQRLVERGISHEAPEKRFGETVLPLSDPD